MSCLLGWFTKGSYGLLWVTANMNVNDKSLKVHTLKWSPDASSSVANISIERIASQNNSANYII